MPLAPQVLDAVDLVSEAGQLGPTRAVLAVAAPPCPGCRYWLPTVATDLSGRAATVQLCASPREQQPDFSCFRPKGP